MDAGGDVCFLAHPAQFMQGAGNSGIQLYGKIEQCVHSFHNESPE